MLKVEVYVANVSLKEETFRDKINVLKFYEM